jgi:uncharacterized protein YecE (DUF72 family)
MEFRVGCSGWFYWHWKRRFYPPELPVSEWFQFYRRRFNTVELNAPFYKWPKPQTVRSWLKFATYNFRFCVKVNQLITHEKRFIGTKWLIREFHGIAEILGQHMGCFLFQCPPSFSYSDARLRKVLEQLDPAFPNVLEFRHRSWWQPKVFDVLRERRIGFCSVSAPGLPDDLVETSDQVYLRFHGSRAWYRHDYSEAELAGWANRLRACKAETCWAFFNNDFNANAARNAAALKRLLRAPND